MIVAMDLNASPLPEEDEDIFEEKIHVEEIHAPEERPETGADIARRVSFVYKFLSFLIPFLYHDSDLVCWLCGAMDKDYCDGTSSYYGINCL